MSTRTAGPQGYVSIANVQERLGVCRSTVERLVKSGALGAKRMGRLILIPESALAAYLKSLPPAF